MSKFFTSNQPNAAHEQPSATSHEMIQSRYYLVFAASEKGLASLVRSNPEIVAQPAAPAETRPANVVALRPEFSGYVPEAVPEQDELSYEEEARRRVNASFNPITGQELEASDGQAA